MKWSKEKANSWYEEQPWLVGCNFLPSSAINQLEMFQEDTFDKETIERELNWAKELGFNSLRVYLHDLLWSEKNKFRKTFEKFLDICEERNIKPIIVLFDDCHRPYPKLGKQPLPVKGVHNSGWKQSPGMELVNQVDEKKIDAKELNRIKEFVQGVLKNYSNDERILMWDIYNEPGQFGIGDKALRLLQYTWEWAHEIRPSQPLTVGCYNWGFVAGKSQTHFGWSTILELQDKKKKGEFVNEGDELPEPKEWFHDIYRIDGSPFSKSEIKFIKEFLAN